MSPELIEEFVGALRAKNTSWRPTSKRLSWLVEYLHDVWVIAAPAVRGPQTAEQVVWGVSVQPDREGHLACLGAGGFVWRRDLRALTWFPV